MACTGLFVTLGACYYDIEEDLYPNGCDTTNVTFSGGVVPILESTCVTCHNQLSQNGSVLLEGYENVKIVVDNGKLLGAIMHEPGFSAMPQGGPMLPDCSIMKIQAWVDAGAPDN